MSDLETLIRETLTDNQRRLAPPHDTVGWVGRAVRRQRRKHALAGVAATALVTLAAAAVVVPLVSNKPATYVAGRPDAATGLLPWKPAGTLVEESDVVISAVEAWENLADDEPAGDVYLVTGERWDDTEMVLLQARTDSGAASVALLTTSGGATGPWDLRDAVALPPDVDVEALMVPAGTIPQGAMPPGAGPGSPASLVLEPRWRTGPGRSFAPSVGSQLVPARQEFGDKRSWQPLERFSGYGWWIPLTMGEGGSLPPTKVVLDHERHGYATTAPVLELDGSGDLAALTPSEVSFRLLPREQASPEWLGNIAAVAELLNLAGPYEVTVLDTGIGSFGFKDRRSKLNTETLFAQFTAPELTRPVLVGYATTGDVVSCFAQRPVPAADVTLLPLVGLGCSVPVAGGQEFGVQGSEIWTNTFFTDPSWKSKGLEVSVTMVRGQGQSTTHNLGSSPYPFGVAEEATEPVRRYLFTLTGFGDNAETIRWVWPASSP